MILKSILKIFNYMCSLERLVFFVLVLIQIVYQSRTSYHCLFLLQSFICCASLYFFRVGQIPSTWSVTRQIINESGFGLNGLNRGLTATIGRNGVFNMIYFGFYHSVKGILPEYKVNRKSTCDGFAAMTQTIMFYKCLFSLEWLVSFFCLH